MGHPKPPQKIKNTHRPPQKKFFLKLKLNKGVVKPSTPQKKLAKLDGVTDAKIDFESKLATVVYNKNAKSSEDLVETVMKLSKDYVVSNVNTTAIETKK